MKKQFSRGIWCVWCWGCLFVASVALSGCHSENDRTRSVRLRTEYLEEPIGLGTPVPRFTWEYAGDEADFMASCYEIVLGTSPEELRSYRPGTPLEAHTRYYWRVRVWDGEGCPCRVFS